MTTPAIRSHAAAGPQLRALVTPNGGPGTGSAARASSDRSDRSGRPLRIASATMVDDGDHADFHHLG